MIAPTELISKWRAEVERCECEGCQTCLIATMCADEMEAALSHAAGQEAVARQCRLIAIATGEVVDDWRECSKESFDVDGGRSRDGAYLRTEYRALYLTPAQPPASAGVGRDSALSRGVPEDVMAKAIYEAHASAYKTLRLPAWEELGGIIGDETVEHWRAIARAAIAAIAAKRKEG